MDDRLLKDLGNNYNTDYCGRILKAFIFSSGKSSCMNNYVQNTFVYECKLRNKQMNIKTYEEIYNPHWTVGDKIFNKEININSDEYINDKKRRINNFDKYGRFEI